jgi:hypothetical protein
MSGCLMISGFTRYEHAQNVKLAHNYMQALGKGLGFELPPRHPWSRLRAASDRL